MQYYARIEHGDYYRNRWSEEELRCDFPGDEILIEGLHAMRTRLVETLSTERNNCMVYKVGK